MQVGRSRPPRSDRRGRAPFAATPRATRRLQEPGWSASVRWAPRCFRGGKANDFSRQCYVGTVVYNNYLANSYTCRVECLPSIRRQSQTQGIRTDSPNPFRRLGVVPKLTRSTSGQMGHHGAGHRRGPPVPGSVVSFCALSASSVSDLHPDVFAKTGHRPRFRDRVLPLCMRGCERRSDFLSATRAGWYDSPDLIKKGSFMRRWSIRLDRTSRGVQ
jgi:hypothetical protein